jgi:spermine oxidase
LKQHQSGLFVPALPADKVKVIENLKMGTVNKIFLEFETPFWDLENAGIMFLNSGDELDNQVLDETNWVRHLLGFDAVLNLPNMLVGWIAGPASK